MIHGGLPVQATPLSLHADATGGWRPRTAAGGGRPQAGLEAVEKVFTAWIWGSGFIAGRIPLADRVTNRPVTLVEVLHLGHRAMVTDE